MQGPLRILFSILAQLSSGNPGSIGSGRKDVLVALQNLENVRVVLIRANGSSNVPPSPGQWTFDAHAFDKEIVLARIARLDSWRQSHESVVPDSVSDNSVRVESVSTGVDEELTWLSCFFR